MRGPRYSLAQPCSISPNITNATHFSKSPHHPRHRLQPRWHTTNTTHAGESLQHTNHFTHANKSPTPTTLAYHTGQHATCTTPVDLVTFTEEILNGKLHFLCSVMLLIFMLHSQSYEDVIKITLIEFEYISCTK